MTKRPKEQVPVLEVAPGVQVVHGRSVADRDVKRRLAPGVREVRRTAAQVRDVLGQQRTVKG